MYANCSEQYWKERKKSNLYRSQSVLIAVIILTVLVGVIVQTSHKKRDQEVQKRWLVDQSWIRPSATETHYIQCESNMRYSTQRECLGICSSELMSIPRPTIHQACSQGCTNSFLSAAVVGCREGPEDDAHKKALIRVHETCERYQNTPRVLSTCRKYYREGTKKGRLKGNTFINNLLDDELANQRRNFEGLNGNEV